MNKKKGSFTLYLSFLKREIPSIIQIVTLTGFLSTLQHSYNFKFGVVFLAWFLLSEYLNQKMEDSKEKILNKESDLDFKISFINTYWKYNFFFSLFMMVLVFMLFFSLNFNS